MAGNTVIDAMWDDSPIDVSTEVNFIWSIANKLRGPYQSDKYKENPNFPPKAMYRISGFQF